MYKYVYMLIGNRTSNINKKLLTGKNCMSKCAQDNKHTTQSKRPKPNHNKIKVHSCLSKSHFRISYIRLGLRGHDR